jgi:thymidylate kinase
MACFHAGIACVASDPRSPVSMVGESMAEFSSMIADDTQREATWHPIVALEGPSGVGKSTLLNLVSDNLLRKGVSFDRCSNNDSGRWKPVIRGLAGVAGRPLSLALATAAARAELREAARRPQLCDRFVVSTLVYQRFAGVPMDYLYSANRPMLAGSVTFVLRIDAEALAARRCDRIRRSDWFKDRLGVREEIDLYDEAAALLRDKGHDVRALDASLDIGILSQRLSIEIAILWQRFGTI